MDARQQDRRKAPRRAEDVRLHYAREALIAAALALHDGPKDSDEAMRFDRAVERYRAAELMVVAS